MLTYLERRDQKKRGIPYVRCNQAQQSFAGDDGLFC